MWIKVVIILCLLVVFSGARTDDSISAVEKLDPELRALLQQEMRAIEAGMKDMLTFSAAGDFKQVENLARQIENSFILKQKLTDQQMHQLHTLLPADFLQQDQQFHYYAGMLQHVAANKKPELVAFYYSQLLESCGNCHQVHAQHRFPHFKAQPKADVHAH